MHKRSARSLHLNGSIKSGGTSLFGGGGSLVLPTANNAGTIFKVRSFHLPSVWVVLLRRGSRPAVLGRRSGVRASLKIGGIAFAMPDVSVLFFSVVIVVHGCGVSYRRAFRSWYCFLPRIPPFNGSIASKSWRRLQRASRLTLPCCLESGGLSWTPGGWTTGWSSAPAKGGWRRRVPSITLGCCTLRKGGITSTMIAVRVQCLRLVFE